MKFHGLRVTIITPRDEAGEFLTRELQSLRVTTRSVLPYVGPLPSDADVVYCVWDPSLSRRMAKKMPASCSHPDGGCGLTSVVVIVARNPIMEQTMPTTLPRPRNLPVVFLAFVFALFAAALVVEVIDPVPMDVNAATVASP